MLLKEHFGDSETIFGNIRVKGSVKRNLRWVENGVKSMDMGFGPWPSGHYFVILFLPYFHVWSVLPNL
jgi:hypothetical protein